MSQFYYKQKFNTGNKNEDGSPEIAETEMSFNTELVLVTIKMQDGRLKVKFNDWHEEIMENQPFEKKNTKGMVTGIEYRNRRVTIVSEIDLSPEDGKRFKVETSNGYQEWEGFGEEIEPKKVE